MLSYQHEYHFGNHADILKHLTLTLILSHLNEKTKPYSLIDAHAGAGRYSISDERNEKTGEFSRGVSLLLSQMNDNLNKEPFKTYFDMCRAYADKNYYAGSPEIMRCCARECDSITLMELHPQEIEKLKDNMKLPTLYGSPKAQKIAIHHRNSYEGVLAITPPEPKRGLLLLDPSYEETSDFENVAEIAEAMKKKWSVGIVAVWYPLLAHRKCEISMLKERLSVCAREGSDRGVLCAELCVQDENDESLPRLFGSGMVVINPPWKLKDELSEILPPLAKILSESDGTASAEIL